MRLVVASRQRAQEDLSWTIEACSREYPDRIAIIDAEQNIQRTYTEFEENTCRIANLLWALGVRPGDNFGLLMQNSTEFLEILFGAAKIGATAVLVNRRLTAAEMAYELEDSSSVGLIYSSRFDDSVAELRSLLATSRWWCRSGSEPTNSQPSSDYDLKSLAAEASDRFEPLADVELAEAGWVIIYTSGTTGKPKGVVLTQSGVVAANNLSKRFLWSRYGAALLPAVRSLVTAGMNHIGGLCTSSAPVLADGGTLIVLDEFDPRKTLRAIEKYRVNLAFSVGTMWNSVVEENLKDYDLSSLRVVGTCISPHTDHQLRQLSEGLGAEVYYMFGQTETTTGLITTRHTADLWERPGTVGRPYGYTNVRIVSAAGEVVPAGEVGELQYRGPTLFREYYGRSEETKNAFEDGWFKSGDLVRADADGYLYFVDRLKDMVKTGGLNVFTIEVEQVLVQHPDVRDAAVAGIPDSKWGEAVTAFVVPAAGTTPDADALIAYCKQHLAHYKVPKRIEFVPEIPVNSLGKKLKRKLVSALLSPPETAEAGT
ncbi:class I adenylate-forming enzyme family protein [Streptomyces chartreusis]